MFEASHALKILSASKRDYFRYQNQGFCLPPSPPPARMPQSKAPDDWANFKPNKISREERGGWGGGGGEFINRHQTP